MRFTFGVFGCHIHRKAGARAGVAVTALSALSAVSLVEVREVRSPAALSSLRPRGTGKRGVLLESPGDGPGARGNGCSYVRRSG